MEHIRWAKRRPDYEANQRHCLYGLDADLIMLSLVSHEPHFCLLREVVSFGGGAKGQPSREVLQNPKKEHFILFQIGYANAHRLHAESLEHADRTCALLWSFAQMADGALTGRLLREYMELEFSSSELGFPFDIERFVDDFVLFCMLIGNDFLPSED